MLGLCADDIPRIAQAVNTAQRRLLFAKEAGDESWYGTWSEISFTASSTSPYVTLPRDVARLEHVAVCDCPAPVNNQFYEYLQFGNGRMPKSYLSCGQMLQGYSRNNAVTFHDLASTPQYISVYPTAAEDAGKRVLLQGTDLNGNIVYSRDVLQKVTGVFVSLSYPFISTPFAFGSITGIQKDVTAGPVLFFQVDASTGEQSLLHTMEPSETTANYRRYYFGPLPNSCCCGVDGQVQIRAIAKMELIPVAVDTDYTLIQNVEAIIEEAASARYSTIDTLSAKQMAAERHKQAIDLLNGELTHYLGQESPAIVFAPFGSARLEHRMIGNLI